MSVLSIMVYFYYWLIPWFVLYPPIKVLVIFYGIIKIMSMHGPEVFGADPARIKWQIVRGDTSPLRVEFLQDDEITYFDTSDWTYEATSYDPQSDALDSLEITPGVGYVDIMAPASITELWGTGYKTIVTELTFDLQVVIDSDTVWTPLLGTISVIGDITGSL